MIDPRQFRNALGHFATGVTIVTTRDAQGEPVGVTVNSFASVSLEPPLVLWSLAKKSWSLAAFEHNPNFAIHVLASDQQSLSDRFARAGTDKFADLDTANGLGNIPLLPNCAAVFQCTVEHRYDGGDHLILVGRVQDFSTTEHPPLLFYRGRYAAPEPETLSFAGLMRAVSPAAA
ncbi:flavin reductase family protein [Parazoarcus communis]|uniref:Flavin reductase n=1 Tax=Parazoarcus communis SWub3 = DSM 12120 TaxID=1121029 RepID=A0A323UVH7_9RHOO|nr:flavin reductase family protein [Parazoarcus communis]NMG72822.1 flavin reductase [Parazoarcus communis SWub3 = DSM 12120]PZA15943.1 flavin reductase [Azoarcus communis] [Parazoarcus communis SWub3 = DSM 12120]